MISNSEMINVKNRSYGTVGYSLPEMGIKRKFQKNESKKISMEELRKLSYQPGGQFLINNSLIVENKEALKELNPNYEPEYFYTEDEVVKLLLSGTMDEFMDCLDFAPQGVIDLIRVKAVELEVADVRKREAITKKTGFNIDAQIRTKQLAEMDEPEQQEPVKQRRVAVEQDEKPARRVAAPAQVEETVIQEAPASRYKIVQK